MDWEDIQRHIGAVVIVAGVGTIILVGGGFIAAPAAIVSALGTTTAVANGVIIGAAGAAVVGGVVSEVQEYRHSRDRDEIGEQLDGFRGDIEHNAEELAELLEQLRNANTDLDRRFRSARRATQLHSELGDEIQRRRTRRQGIELREEIAHGDDAVREEVLGKQQASQEAQAEMLSLLHQMNQHLTPSPSEQPGETLKDEFDDGFLVKKPPSLGPR